MRPEFDWKTLGHRLRVARLALGISEQDAADEVGVTVRTYRRYEDGAKQRGCGVVDFALGNGFLDWLCSGEGITLDDRFCRTSGKVAILPALSRKRREKILEVRREAGEALMRLRVLEGRAS